jgi:hypothetical protein
MQWKITKSSLSISSNSSSSFDRGEMITLLEEETWLSLEENMFGFK